MSHSQPYDGPLVVIGGSAGGFTALRELLPELPRGFPYPVLITLHLGPAQGSSLDTALQRFCELPLAFATDGEAICPGQVRIAPADRHLIVEPGRLHLIRGPRENRARPAIDPLFRSAAVAYDARVVGVVLSGYLDDGSAGALAIKRCGGRVLVQSAASSFVPDMPTFAREAVGDALDGAASPIELAHAVGARANEVAGARAPVPSDIAREAEIVQRQEVGIRRMHDLGELAPVTCPSCDGPLWRLDDEKLDRYRCHTGHAFTALALAAGQDEQVEFALWSAVRILEERTKTLQSLSKRSGVRRHGPTLQRWSEESERCIRAAQTLREILLHSPTEPYRREAGE